MVGLNMAFSRKVLEKVPAFDTELGPGALGFNDDFFFSWQVENAGYRIARRFEVSVEHHYDASRLHRVYALQRAVACGRSDAYLEHHWHHRRIWFARWHLRRSTLRLALFRWLRKNEMRDQERIPSWEFDLVKQVNFYKQYMVERWRPRNYQKNGLVKRTPTSRPHSTA